MTKKNPVDIYSVRRFRSAMTKTPHFDEFSLKRSALVIKSKRPFQDWVKKTVSFKVNSTDFIDANVYLIPSLDTHEQMEKWLKKNYDAFFRDQMHRWQEDGYLWMKQKRTFKLFEQWFDYSIHSTVYDTMDKANFRK